MSLILHVYLVLQHLICSSFISAFSTSKVVCQINLAFKHYFFFSLKLGLHDSLSFVIYLKKEERGHVNFACSNASSLLTWYLKAMEHGEQLENQLASLRNEEETRNE